MIVADTGAILALVDTSDRHHKTLLAVFEERPTAWILPWAILRGSRLSDRRAPWGQGARGMA